MEMEQQDCCTADQTVPDSPKSQQEAGNTDVMYQHESGLLVKNMEVETPEQKVGNDVSADTVQCEASSVVTSDADKEENVPDVVNTISEIVDPNLEVSTDPVDDGLINEIAKKVDTEDRMTFCIEKPAESLLPVTSQGEKIEEVLVVHPVCAFARPVNMEYDLIEETDVMSELAKEVQHKVNDAQENSASGGDSATASNEEEKGEKTPSSEGDKVNGNSGEIVTDEGIAPVVEHVVRRSQRVYNSLVGPDYAVKVVAPLPLYRKSALPAETSVVDSARKRPKPVAALKTKKSQLKSGRRPVSAKSDMSRRTPVRMESLKMCNPTTSRASTVVSTAYRKDGKGVKKLPKFLSQFGVNSNGAEKTDVKKTVPKNRGNTSLADAESGRSATPDKPLAKSASTASLIRKLKMKDGSEVPTPRRSQRIYNSLNGPEEAVNVITPTTRNCRPNDEVVYNSLVGEERDVKLEIPNIRKRIIKKPKPADKMKKTRMSSDEEGNPGQGYGKFDGSLAESHSGIPLATRIAHEFSQTADASEKRRSTRSQSKTEEKEQSEEDSVDKINTDSITSASPPSEASILVASSYYTTKRGTQTEVTYSTPSTLSYSTASKRRPAMSASVQKTGTTQRKQNLKSASSRPSSATSGTSVASERSLRSCTKTAKGSVDTEKNSTQQKEESPATKSASLKKSRSSSKLN